MREQRERDNDCLYRILDYCDRIDAAKERYGDSYESFSQDADFRDVIKTNLFQIGENANLLSEECKEKLSVIPWHQVVGMRNMIAHAYVKIDDRIIWNTVQDDIAVMRKEINKAGIV